MQIDKKLLSAVIFACSIVFPVKVSADGNTIDKVYHPYVLPLETEVEWRGLYENDNDQTLDNQQTHRLGIGASFVEYWFTEIYLIGENSPAEDFDINAFELEAKVQLTEQGEFAADWGLLFEFERDFNKNSGELSAGVLTEKELGRWVGALNLFIEYEWGETIKTEIETSLASQLRYRYSRFFEPAIELYLGQQTAGIGPVFMGDIRLAIAQKIHWEFGVILGIQDDTPEQTIRALLEYEF